jgi:hypothetical protein
MSGGSCTPAEDYADLANQTKICIKGIINEMRNDRAKTPLMSSPPSTGNFKIVIFC